MVFSHDLPVLFTISPASNGNWMVDTVPSEPGSFEQRLPLPERWAGLQNEALAAETGWRMKCSCTYEGLWLRQKLVKGPWHWRDWRWKTWGNEGLDDGTSLVSEALQMQPEEVCPGAFPDRHTASTKIGLASDVTTIPSTVADSRRRSGSRRKYRAINLR